MNSDMDDAIEVVKLSFSAVLDRTLLKEKKNKKKQDLLLCDSKQSQEGQELLWVEEDITVETTDCVRFTVLSKQQ
jgi:hypothetical protein